MKRDFKGKVILITGGTGNLGQAIAGAFAQVGAKVVALDLQDAALKNMQDHFESKGFQLLTTVCDITDKVSCAKATQFVLNHYGRIDVLVNNAGITHIERYVQMDKSKAITRRVMEVNFFGAVNCTEYCLEQIIQNQGCIVNISSVAGFAPLLGRTAYAASKHALHGFFESLYSELRDKGVHCLMVCPSFIQAPKDFDESEGQTSIYQKKKTIGKDVSASDIAKDIVHCCTQNKPLLVSGKTGRLSYWLRRFLPGVYFNAMCNKLKHDL
jgi:NAD(P)-dependent dehydrogenase (short-subunit alcohol dehydrogenase family)